MKLSLLFLFMLSSYSFTSKGPTLITGHIPPYSIENTNSISGICVDIIKEAFRRMNLDLEIKLRPWARSQKIVQSSLPSEKLLIAPISRVPEREDLYDWISPIMTYKFHFISLDKSINLANFNEIKEHSICVQYESPSEWKLEEMGVQNLVKVNREAQCMKMLLKNRVKIVFVHGKISGAYTFKSNGGDPAKLNYHGHFESKTIYLAARHFALSKEEKNKIQKAIKKMKEDGTYEKIISKYNVLHKKRAQ